MNGPLWSMSWKYWGHFDIGPCGCQRGIHSHCITLSQGTMTYLIIWTCWCEIRLRRRLHGRNTCFYLWSQLDRSCLNTTLKWLQWWACFWFVHISSIHFGSGDRLESGTKKWISILRTRHPILPNSKRHFCSMWRMNTVPNINVCRSISTTAYWAAISSPLQQLQDPVNHPLIHLIYSAMIKNISFLTMRLRRQLD